MNDHVDVEKLSAYLDGAVPARERRALEGHLATCADCAARRAALEGAVRSLRGLPAVAVTPAESESIRQAVLQGAGATSRAPAGVLRWRPRWASWATLGGAAAALAAVAAVVVGFAVIRSGPGNKSAGQSAATAARPLQAPDHLSLAPTPSPAPPAFANDAEVRAYAISLPGVANVVRTSAGLAPPAAAGVPAPGPGVEQNGQAQKVPLSGDLAPATTLGGCERAALPSGAPPLYGTPVLYQGSPAWLIAYAVPPASGAAPGTASNQVTVEIRSQAACGLLDTATLVP